MGGFQKVPATVFLFLFLTICRDQKLSQAFVG